MQILQTRLHGKRVFLGLFYSLSLFSPPCDMLSFHQCYEFSMSSEQELPYKTGLIFGET